VPSRQAALRIPVHVQANQQENEAPPAFWPGALRHGRVARFARRRPIYLAQNNQDTGRMKSSNLSSNMSSILSNIFRTAWASTLVNSPPVAF